MPDQLDEGVQHVMALDRQAKHDHRRLDPEARSKLG
jgi:hypothetical protein